MSFCLLPEVAYTWRQRERPRRVATPGKNVRVSVFGAYRWPDGPFRFALGTKGVTAILWVDLVAQLVARAHPLHRILLLVLDHGSAQTSRAGTRALQAAFPWVVPVWLPRYSSEQLNDIENLWQHFKDDYFAAMLVAIGADFPAAVRALFRPLRRPGALRHFLKPRRRTRRPLGK